MFVIRDAAEPSGREVAIIDWGYNAWGGKYPPYDLDDAVPQRVGDELGLPVFRNSMVLEGGSIEVNGSGSLLTTEGCLLNPNRNPQLGREQIEQNLRDYLGARNILWLGDGVTGDDTDGHVDDLTRFVDRNTVLTVVEDDPRDENFEPLRENLIRLQHMTDEEGYPLRIYQLPMPRPVEYEGQRLPASYANFYIGNEVILLPVFDCPQDARAKSILEVLFRGRRVVPIASSDLVWGLGAFHCLTQQQPAVSA
jgi:agmatine deiminase